MNILIVGSGAREHAIAAALCRSTQAAQLFCYGEALNPGIKQLVSHYRVGKLSDTEAIVRFAIEKNINMAVIGPEAPLEQGLADLLWEKDIPVIGPKRQLAKIETSKLFARDLMQKYKIAGCPKYRQFMDMTGVSDFLQELGEGNYVVKANGLMGGKGVKVAGDHLHSFAEAILFCNEIFACGQRVLIEEKLVGQEFSLMAFCDGQHLVSMPVVQDHKRAFVADKGPNTGGMGSYSDANHSLPFLTKEDVRVANEINEAIINAVSVETKDRYIGILYGSFIATKKGIYAIEFNARFGDPEALNVLTILQSDLIGIFQAMEKGTLNDKLVDFAHQATVCKYAVPEGYPDSPVKDVPIDICAVKNKSNLYLASVNAANGKIYATGSRTAAYVGVAHSIFAAEEIAEREVCGIGGPLFHRKDIGTEQLIKHRIDEMRRLRQE